MKSFFAFVALVCVSAATCAICFSHQLGKVEGVVEHKKVVGHIGFPQAYYDWTVTIRTDGGQLIDVDGISEGQAHGFFEGYRIAINHGAVIVINDWHGYPIR